MKTASVKNGKVQAGDVVQSYVYPDRGCMTVQGFIRSQGKVYIKVLDKKSQIHDFTYIAARNCEKVG